MDIVPIRGFFTGLQDRIIGELEAAEGQAFLRDACDRPQGGGGISRLIEDGGLFERGGVNFSHVLGEQMPASATAHRPELAGRRWEAMGVSLVLHPRNPYCPTEADYAIRVSFWGDEIESIQRIDPASGKKISDEKVVTIFPANLFVTGKESLHQAIHEIQDDLVRQVGMFESDRKFLEAKRLKERTEFDMEMMRELGYCSGIENYSRYFDRRQPGARPFCLIDNFPDDFLMIIDESHVTVPQVRAMCGGDRSRKVNLVDYGFRLPAALDNRPLTFNEFESMINQVVLMGTVDAPFGPDKRETPPICGASKLDA